MAPKGINAPAPTTAEVIGGVYNATPPVLVDGQAAALQIDVNGKLITSGGGAGSSNVTIVGVAPALPLTQPLPVELSDGTQAVGTAGNPLSVNVITGGGSNASVGTVGVAAPASATEIGGSDGTNLRAVRVDTDGTVNEDLTKISGSAVATAAAGIQKVGLTDGTGTAITSTGAALDENVKNWGGTAVQAAQTAATDGTGANPIVRNIPRRFGQVLTTTPLAANATFTSAWFDTNQTGTISVEATALADQAGSANGFLFQESDDQVNVTNITASAAVQFGSGATALANTLTQILCAVKKRYWRVSFKNGVTLQGSFSLLTSESAQAPISGGLASGGGNASFGAPIFVLGAIPGTGGGDAASGVAMPNLGGTASAPLVSCGVATNGGNNPTISAMRTPNIFKTASIAATSTTTASNPIWTPAAGKKFRVMRFIITAQGLAATATGVVTVTLVDSATTITIGTFDIDIPAIASVVSGVNLVSGAWIDLGNGYLSLVANNVLNFGISAAGAGTVGTYRINVCGTEE